MSERLLLQVFDASVRALAPALAAALALWFWRKRLSAAARHALWTAVLVSMLVLLFAGAAVPPMAVRVLPAAEVPALMAPAPPASVRAPVPMPSAPGLPPVPRPRVAWGWQIAAWVYMAGALLLLGRFGAGLLVARRLREASRPAPWPEALPAELRESGRVVVPLTAGWLRPVILLPAAWRDWEETKRRAVLAHELAHVRRRDWLVTALAAAGKALFWFHPLAWFLERRLNELAEQAADDASVLATGDAPRYANALLDMAAALEGGGGRLFPAGAAMARCSRIGARIDRVLDRGRSLSAGMTKAGWSALVLCGIPLVYGAAALQVERAAPRVELRSADGTAYVKALTEAWKLTPADVQQMEQALAANPEDIEARVKLISYYFQNAMREPRLRHLLWLIEHHPDSEVFEMSLAGVPSRDNPLNTRDDYEAVRRLWIEQTGRHPSNARVLANAARFLAPDDVAMAAELLKRARQPDPANSMWTFHLVVLYARVIRASLKPGWSPDPWNQPAFARAVQAELETSTDVELISDVGVELISPITAPLNQNPAAALGEKLLKRAQSLDPRNRGVAGALEALAMERRASASPPRPPTVPQPGASGQRIRIGANVAAANLIKQVPPAYPPQAQQARIQGTVRFRITIGPEGDVRNVQLVSGHPLLVPAALDAVKQWVYKPILLNGAAVEVVTQVDVHFALSPAGAPQSSAAMANRS